MERFIFAPDFSIGDGLAVGVGEAVGLVLAGAVGGAHKARIAMQAPMTNELFVFMFVSVGWIAGNIARAGGR
jgi:hypothetical protein